MVSGPTGRKGKDKQDEALAWQPFAGVFIPQIVWGSGAT